MNVDAAIFSPQELLEVVALQYRHPPAGANSTGSG
jgi:hypothetical protein